MLIVLSLLGLVYLGMIPVTLLAQIEMKSFAESPAGSRRALKRLLAAIGWPLVAMYLGYKLLGDTISV